MTKFNTGIDVLGAIKAGLGVVAVPGGYVSNLGISWTAGTFKLVGSNGSDLSTTNKAYITMPSTTLGQSVTLEVTSATHLFQDANHATLSHIAGENFDTTPSAAWNAARPFMLYAVNSNDTSAGLEFAISPDPIRQVTPSSGVFLGYQGVPSTTADKSSMFFLTATNITASHISKPCIPIGSLTMDKTLTDDWSGNFTANDGIGKFYNFGGRVFTFPTGQMGATSEYFDVSAGTPPSWASAIIARYSISLNGRVKYVFNTRGSGPPTNGTNPVSLLLSAPYAPTGFYSAGAIYVPSGNVILGSVNRYCAVSIVTNSSLFGLRYDSVGTAVQANDFSSSSDDIFIDLDYKAFT